MERETTQAPGAVGQPLFATTHWNVVLAAANEDAPEAGAALERLCRTYWYALYAYVRHRGHSPEDSQDLTQEFFHRLVRMNFLAQVDSRKGKFRSFLLAAMNHFLSNEWDRARTLKRGGHMTFVSLDESTVEQRYLDEQAGGHTPAQLYERAWAMAVLAKVLSRLRAETAAAGQGERFEELKVILIGETPSVTYNVLAARLGTTEGALKMAVKRLRRRYAELLRDELAQTVADDVEVDQELAELRAVLSSPS
jgi:RNA polymerase sigma-70 factor (ECF subfamily)